LTLIILPNYNSSGTYTFSTFSEPSNKSNHSAALVSTRPQAKD